MNHTPRSLITFARMKQAGEPIAALTCYDASFARLVDAAGVDLILVGDSLGMVLQGHNTTLSVTLDDMVYHTRCVARGTQQALIVADLPFLSYTTPAAALAAAQRLLGEGGAQMVKLEGGADLCSIVSELTRFGVPVCAHLGLLPQSVHQLGGYRYQGRAEADAERIRNDALALQAAGASLVVLECIPAALATMLSQTLTIPTIGIGAGNGCDGQVLVLYDLLGISADQSPRFSRNFLNGQPSIGAAIADYVTAVKQRTFPGAEHTLA